MKYEDADDERVQELLRNAQNGDALSMEELGDYYISLAGNDGTAGAFRIGIEWYERAARCNNYQAGLKIGELTGKRFVYSDYLSFDVASFLILVICFFPLAFWAAKNKVNPVSIFLILSCGFGFAKLMRTIYSDNENRNDAVLRKWYFNSKGSGVITTISIWLGIIMLVTGYILAIWKWDHTRPVILIVKVLILVVSIGLTAKRFRTLIRTKWKYTDHTAYITKIADELEISRLRAEEIVFIIKTIANIAIVILLSFL